MTLNGSPRGRMTPLRSYREATQGPELPFKLPGVWAEDNPPGLAWNIPPIVVELKPGVNPTRKRQYVVLCRAQIGIQKYLERLLKYGILQP